jgi:hypothetical protein
VGAGKKFQKRKKKKLSGGGEKIKLQKDIEIRVEKRLRKIKEKPCK